MGCMLWYQIVINHVAIVDFMTLICQVLIVGEETGEGNLEAGAEDKIIPKDTVVSQIPSWPQLVRSVKKLVIGEQVKEGN